MCLRNQKPNVFFIKGKIFVSLTLHTHTDRDLEREQGYQAGSRYFDEASRRQATFLMLPTIFK